jgi:hypothetical protein
MQITVTETVSQLPADTKRRKMVLQNTGSNTIFWGWESTTTASGSTQGVLLAAGATLSLGGSDMGLANTIFLVCGTGLTSTLNYTQSA